MLVVSRRDEDTPRALAVCTPITTSTRDSEYEVSIGKPKFLHETSYVNVQGMQAIQHHELKRMIGRLPDADLQKVKGVIEWLFDIDAKKQWPRSGAGDRGCSARKQFTSLSLSANFCIMTAQLRKLRELPISERILLVEDLWDSIAEDASACRLSVEQSDELNARLDALDADPRQGAHWEIVKQRIVASL